MQSIRRPARALLAFSRPAAGATTRAALLGLGLLAAAAPVASSAQSTGHDWYIGGDVLGSFAFLSGTDVTGTAATVRDEKTDDLVAGLQGHLGRRFGSFRAEIEYSWRYRYDYNTDLDTGGGGTTRLKSNVQTQSVMLNVLRDFDVGKSWAPYLGGGLGWVENDSDVDRTALGSGATTSRSNSESDLAWSLMAGVRWHFAERWSARLGYRFSHLGKIDSGAFPDGLTQKASHLYGHDILLGLQYRF